jgi:TatD DNase family protein
MVVPGLVDSHCHLDGEPDPHAVVERARAAGVTGLVCVGTDVASSRRSLELAGSLGPGVWATVGLHPHHADRRGGEGVEGVAALASGGWGVEPVAIGECGLDYHYDHAPRPDQREAFGAQVELARRLGLALVVHTREAWADTFAILEEAGVPARVVFHCFTGGPEEARRCLELGAFVSFSGIVTFGRAEEVRAAARLCPAERLLVETDSPYLAPVPYRGRRNEPALVTVVVEALAALRGVAVEELAGTTSAAAAAAFGVSVAAEP